MNSGIYCYENLLDGKKYVGQAINLKNRIAKHESNFKRGSLDGTYESPILWRAVRKHGRENFKLSILEYVPAPLLDEKESYYIKKLNSHYLCWGYNFQLGGNHKCAPGYKRNKTSKYFGVFFKKKKNHFFWMCQIRVNGVQKELEGCLPRKVHHGICN